MNEIAPSPDGVRGAAPDTAVDTVETLLDPATIRARSLEIHEEALAGGTAFRVRPERLERVVDRVMEETRRNYPDGEIPLHGRLEHLKAGGIDRVASLLEALTAQPPRGRPDALQEAQRTEVARSLVDCVLVSVLLDAGAGATWRFVEDGREYPRSEGLALAALSMFREGAFSDDPARPLAVTAAGLERLTVERVAEGFQVRSDNPLAGLEGRTELLQRLAGALRAHPELFGHDPRPGNLISALTGESIPGGTQEGSSSLGSASSPESLTGSSSGSAAGSSRERPQVAATRVLRHLLLGLDRMWPARVTCEGVGFGDVWSYRGRLVPFHKLTQWLTYSLIEPIESAGLEVTGVEALTGLPEYRNGGLFLDDGVLELRDPELARRPLKPSDDAIIEWRALTVTLLDQVGDAVCERMKRSRAELPLARVLQGGTWSAGRSVARTLRPGGGPPLQLESDGTVF